MESVVVWSGTVGLVKKMARWLICIMKQTFTKAFKSPALIAGAVVLLLASAAVYFAWHGDKRGLSMSGSPSFSQGRFSLTVTNSTGRPIVCWVSEPQFRCDGRWSELHIMRGMYFSSRGSFGFFSTNIVASGQAQVVRGREPKYIEAPAGATAWRAAVVWSFLPSRSQQLKAKGLGFILGGTYSLQTSSYTNYLNEVGF